MHGYAKEICTIPLIAQMLVEIVDIDKPGRHRQGVDTCSVWHTQPQRQVRGHPGPRSQVRGGRYDYESDQRQRSVYFGASHTCGSPCS